MDIQSAHATFKCRTRNELHLGGSDLDLGMGPLPGLQCLEPYALPLRFLVVGLQKAFLTFTSFKVHLYLLSPQQERTKILKELRVNFWSPAMTRP